MRAGRYAEDKAKKRTEPDKEKKNRSVPRKELKNVMPRLDFVSKREKCPGIGGRE